MGKETSSCLARAPTFPALGMLRHDRDLGFREQLVVIGQLMRDFCILFQAVQKVCTNCGRVSAVRCLVRMAMGGEQAK